MSKRKKTKKKRSQEFEWIKRASLIVGIGAFMIIGGTYLFVANQGQRHSVEVEVVVVEEEIIRGVPFKVEVDISNRTGSNLNNVDLTIDLSPGLTSLDITGQRNLIIESIDEIPPGSLNKRTFTFVSVGSIDSKESIKSNLSYSIGSARFEAENFLEVSTDKIPIEIEVDRPEQISEGSEFEVEIRYKNNSDINLENLILEADYPSSFQYSNASLEPESLNNRWILGALRAGSEGVIRVRGTLKDNTSSFPIFGARVLISYGNNEYLLGQRSMDLDTSESPLGLSVSLESRRNNVAEIGENLIYKIRYNNRSDIALRDVEIRAKMTGEMFDFNTLEITDNASYSDGAMLWNESTTPKLSILEPGESGDILIGVKLKDSPPTSHISNKNFTIVLNVEIESPSVPYYIEADKTSASTKIETKVKGLTTIEAKALYRDASLETANNGPLPPRVGEATQYTIHWEVVSYLTDVRNTKIVATLPSGVQWVGVVNSSIDEVPIYNPDTKRIIWEIPSIEATRGTISTPIKSVFQIEATPSQDMAAQYQKLLSETILNTTDNFTGLSITASDHPIDTTLLDDPTTTPFDGIVQ